MASLAHESRRIRCRNGDEAYRCACAATSTGGEVEPVREPNGLTIAYQATRPAPELLRPDQRHWTPPAVAEWEYYW